LPWLSWNIKNTNAQFSKAYLTALKFDTFQIIQAMILKKYCIEVPLNDITSIQNFMKSYQAVQTDRQTGDLISLLSFLESRLKRRERMREMFWRSVCVSSPMHCFMA
jgi:hypothetical protein